MKQLHIEELRKALRWQNILEEGRRLENTGSNPSLVGRVAQFGIFRIVPSSPDWPSIRLVCDSSFRSLERSSWECLTRTKLVGNRLEKAVADEAASRGVASSYDTRNRLLSAAREDHLPGRQLDLEHL